MNYREDVLGAAKQLFMKKAEDVRVLNVSQITIIADYFIIASGRSDVHVRSLSDDIQKYMFDHGKQRLRIEGHREGRWVVLDYGEILIHVFHKKNGSSTTWSACGRTATTAYRLRTPISLRLT